MNKNLKKGGFSENLMFTIHYFTKNKIWKMKKMYKILEND